MRFSVVVPAFNRSDSLPATIRSLVAQEEFRRTREMEVIVVDDGSTDGTAQSIDDLRTEGLRLLRQDNRGVSAARNAGIEAAQGDYLAFVDSDDTVEPDWLKALAAQTRTTEVVGLVCCGYWRVEQGARTAVLPGSMGPAFRSVVGRFAPPGTFLVHRQVLEVSGTYTEELRFSENTELALRMIDACHHKEWKIATVDRPLLTYQRRPVAEYGGERYFQSILDSVEFILASHADKLGRDSRMLSDYHAIASVNATRLGFHERARRHALGAFKAEPLRAKHLARLLMTLTPSFASRFWTRHWPRQEQDRDRRGRLLG